MDVVNQKRICPAEHAGSLDTSFRKLVHNPGKILKPYVREGMTVLDVGCGPGFFTKEMAKLVGRSGKVIAADLQEEMLEKLRKKIHGTVSADIIKTHKCANDRIGLEAKCDFILVFYMLHEVPDQAAFLREIKGLLKQDGKVLIVEPKFHVSKSNFQASIGMMNQAGFAVAAEPNVFFSRAVELSN